jgi:hypothetical protein
LQVWPGLGPLALLMLAAALLAALLAAAVHGW